MLLTGAVLHNRYEIIRRLSAGGMGEVYEAKDLKFGRKVALKRIYFERDEIQRLLADDPALRHQLIQLFEREDALLANLQHPGLPRVTDYFEDGDDRYLVMDFIVGDDLMKMVKDRRTAFPLDEVLPWAYQLLCIV